MIGTDWSGGDWLARLGQAYQGAESCGLLRLARLYLARTGWDRRGGDGLVWYSWDWCGKAGNAELCMARIGKEMSGWQGEVRLSKVEHGAARLAARCMDRSGDVD